MITKGILNTSAPQHQIFKDNMRKLNPQTQTDQYYKAFRLSEPVEQKPGRFQGSERFLRRNQENKRIVGLFARAQQRIEDLEGIKESLRRYQRGSSLVEQMKKQVKSSKQLSSIRAEGTTDEGHYKTADQRQHDLRLEVSDGGDDSIEILYQEGAENNPLSQRRCDQVTQRLYHSKTKSSEAKFLEQRELLKVKSALNHKKKKTHPLQNRIEDIRIKSRLRASRVSADVVVPNDQHTILSVRTCHTRRPTAQQLGVNSSLDSLPKNTTGHRKTTSMELTRRQSEEALLKQQMQLRGKLMNYVAGDDGSKVDEPRIIDRQEYQLKKREEVSYADGLALFNKWQARQEGLTMLR
ncbi:hypothetical protein FGO68_gene15582 [Halteria grandinella]|uniref:Uncharacterized protein n=1 Tax=Halteria grandinella TaxID=5974 RepID=A0A8J8NR92_HALGN|nr:hypothetical protein FGO68_gene15582 [Halteria grandinella]